MSERLIVTGGLGFIGSAFLRRRVQKGERATNLDAHTYAADRHRLPPGQTLVITHVVDVTHPKLVELVERSGANVMVHFAAETHVTRSEAGGQRFFRSNVDGTRNVLESADQAGVELMIHVSTDEVYGPALDRPFSEDEKAPGEGRATSAYARSKAVADDLARAFNGLTNVIVVRPTNCFGPWQHPEKAIPRWAVRALQGLPIPVWGDGNYVRDWMFVDDACAAIELIIERGTPGEVYNIGPQGDVRTNLEIARFVARAAGRDEDLVYLTAYDRPDHDRRYSVDASKLRSLGWRAGGEVESRLIETVTWYAEHEEWWKPLVSEAEELYNDQLRGLR